MGHMADSVRLQGPLLQQDTSDFEEVFSDIKAAAGKSNNKNKEHDVLLSLVRRTVRQQSCRCDAAAQLQPKLSNRLRNVQVRTAVCGADVAPNRDGAVFGCATTSRVAAARPTHGSSLLDQVWLDALAGRGHLQAVNSNEIQFKTAKGINVDGHLVAAGAFLDCAFIEQNETRRFTAQLEATLVCVRGVEETTMLRLQLFDELPGERDRLLATPRRYVLFLVRNNVVPCAVSPERVVRRR